MLAPEDDAPDEELVVGEETAVVVEDLGPICGLALVGPPDSGSDDDLLGPAFDALPGPSANSLSLSSSIVGSLGPLGSCCESLNADRGPLGDLGRSCSRSCVLLLNVTLRRLGRGGPPGDELSVVVTSES